MCPLFSKRKQRPSCRKRWEMVQILTLGSAQAFAEGPLQVMSEWLISTCPSESCAGQLASWVQYFRKCENSDISLRRRRPGRGPLSESEAISGPEAPPGLDHCRAFAQFASPLVQPSGLQGLPFFNLILLSQHLLEPDCSHLTSLYQENRITASAWVRHFTTHWAILGQPRGSHL